MSKFDQFEGSKVEKSLRKGAKAANAKWGEAYDEGIIVLQPHNSGSAAGLRRMALLVTTFLIFKGFVIAHLGAVVYSQAVQTLEQGNLFEQAGAFLMYPDFASSKVASMVVQLVQ